MKGLHVVLVAFAAAVTVTSVAAAGPEAAKQRVGITMRALPNGTFVLTPVGGGRLKADTGTVRHTVADYTPRYVVRQGQSVSLYRPVVWRLEGKRGTLTIREPQNAWVDAGGPRIGTGALHVVRGTGQYAELTGGGRTAHAGPNGGQGAWSAREEGFLTAP